MIIDSSRGHQQLQDLKHHIKSIQNFNLPEMRSCLPEKSQEWFITGIVMKGTTTRNSSINHRTMLLLLTLCLIHEMLENHQYLSTILAAVKGLGGRNPGSRCEIILTATNNRLVNLLSMNTLHHPAGR